MDRGYLTRGDVVWIQHGTTVGYAAFPLCLHTETISTFNREIVSTTVKVGHEYHSRTDVTKERDIIREGVLKVFKEQDAPLCLEILDRFLAHQLRDQPHFVLVIPSGHYVVIGVRVEQGTRIVDLEGLYGAAPTKIYFWQSSWGPLAHNSMEVVGRMDLDNPIT